MLKYGGGLIADENWMSAEPRGFVILQEVREIWWPTGVESFEG